MRSKRLKQLRVGFCAALVTACASAPAATEPEAPRSQAAAPSASTEPAVVAPVRDAAWYAGLFNGCASPDLTTQGTTAEDKIREWVKGAGHGDPGKIELRKGTSKVRGSLSKEQVRGSITANLPDVQWCLDNAREVWPSVHGRVVVLLLIGPDGTVTQSEVQSNDSGIPEVACCIQTKARSWQFPKPEGGGIVIVSYPFVLGSDAG